MKFRKKFRKISIIASAGLIALSLIGCGSQSSQPSSNDGQSSTVQMSNGRSENLASQNYRSGTKAYENVNGGKSTLNPNSWKKDHVIYSNLDHENRTSKGNTAWLDKNNLAHDSLRTRQVVKPTGWHQKFVNNNAIINRGHEIAYSLSKGIDQKGDYNPSQESGDQNNMKNLFTQTAFSNQQLQAIYEGKVRNALKQNDKVVYQVKPIFQGSDKMAKGVQMQAISTNRKLNFNVYIFNVQNGIKFNYADGRSTIDKSMKVPMPAHPINYHNNKQNSYRSHGFGEHNYGYRRRHHHFLRHAAEGYAAYRIGRHMERRHMMHHYYPHYRRHHIL